MLKWIFLCVLPLLLSACGESAGPQVSQEVLALIRSGATVIDVRTEQEVASGKLSQAAHIPHGQIVDGIRTLELDRDAPLVLYCRSGNRAGIAKTALENAGFTRVVNAGGYEALNSALKTSGT